MNKKKHGLHRVVAFLLAVLLCLSGLPANGMTVYAEGETTYWTDNASNSLSGSGTQDDPYLIQSAEDLALLAKSYNTTEATANDTYFKVADDVTTIDLSAHDWVPIDRFFGHLDGNGVSITGLKIGSETAGYSAKANVGLFGRIDSGSVVENLSVDVSIYTNYTAVGDYNVGGVAGFSNGATVDSCIVTGQITATISVNTAANRLVAGGIVGISQNGTSIVNCINKATINANNVDGIVSAAGIAAYTKKTTILNSCNFGSVTADITGTANKIAYAGGIVVHSAADTNKLYNCYNTGIISASSEAGAEYAGSIAGQLGGCTADYVYWLGTENEWIGRDAGNNTTGEHIAHKSETELKAMADTLNTNVEAIKDTYTNLTLKAWGAEAGQYPEPGAAQSSGGEEPNYVAMIGDVEYETLQAAIEAATEGDTITLLEDVDLGETSIVLSKGTLNLNGQTLAAKGLTALAETNVVDSSIGKTGVLKVADFVPAATNAQMPIYNGTGYVFIDFNNIVKQEKDGTVNEDVFKLVFKPSFGTANNTLLGSLGNDAKVTFRIRLAWTDENGENKQTKDLYYADGLVEKVYGEGMAFSVTASGVSNYHNLTITPLVQSTLNTGIEWLGSSFATNQ